MKHATFVTKQQAPQIYESAFAEKSLDSSTDSRRSTRPRRRRLIFFIGILEANRQQIRSPRL